MANSYITIDPNQIIDEKVPRYSTEADNIDATVKNLDTLISDLQEEWHGDASAAFVEQYQELHDSFAAMGPLIRTIGEQLGQAAQNFLDTDSGTASAIRGR